MNDPVVKEKPKAKKNELSDKAKEDSSEGDEEEEEELSDQEDIDAEDEDFKWYNHAKMKDNSYFVFVNCDRRTVKKGEQVFYCYGKRSNAFLLLKYSSIPPLTFYSYGFCYADNRYDSLLLKVKLNVNINYDLTEKDGTFEELLPHMASREDMACAEEIRLKFDAINLSKHTYYNNFRSSTCIFEDRVQKLLFQEPQSKGFCTSHETQRS